MQTQDSRQAASHLSTLLDSRLCRTDIESLAGKLSAPLGMRSWTRLRYTDAFDAWLIAWGAVSEVDVHDHGRSHGAIQVLEGSLVEDYLEAQRASTSDGGWRRRTIRAGQSIEVPPKHVHRVSNPAARPALSLHVYSPPLEEMNFFPAVGRVEVAV